MSVNNPSVELFQKNKAFLAGHMSEKSFSSLFLQDIPDSVFFIDRSSGIPQLYCRNETGKIFIHSRRNPEEEAERQVSIWTEKNNVKFKGLIAVAGVGGLFHLFEIGNRLQQGALLFVADIERKSFIQMLHYHDLSNLLSDRAELVFSISSKEEEIAEDFRRLLRERDCSNVFIFTHPGLLRVQPVLYNSLGAVLINELRNEYINRGTAASYGKDWEAFAIANMPVIISSPKINELNNFFGGKTAIIVAPGPSLTDAIPFIREVSDSALIISTGTALKPLLAAGIQPDFTIAVDSIESIMRQFEGVHDYQGFMLVTHMLRPELLKMFQGQEFFFATDAIPGFNAWLEKLMIFPDKLLAGGTVSTSAIHAAIYLGCKRIIFTGLDLALADDGTSYSPGTGYDIKRYNNMQQVIVPGNYRPELISEKRLAAYLRNINSLIADFIREDASLRFINATTGGAKIANTALIFPDNIKNEIPEPISFNKKDAIRAIHQEGVPKEPAQTVDLVRQTLLELDKLIELAYTAEVLCADMLEADTPLDALTAHVKELNEIDQNIKNLKFGSTLVKGALHLLFIDDFAEKMEMNPADVIMKSRKMYEYLKKTAEWLKAMLKNAYEQCIF